MDSGDNPRAFHPIILLQGPQISTIVTDLVHLLLQVKIGVS